MTPKEDALKLLKISDKIPTLISDYQLGKITLGELDDMIQAQIKIAYELGKASK